LVLSLGDKFCENSDSTILVAVGQSIANAIPALPCNPAVCVAKGLDSFCADGFSCQCLVDLNCMVVLSRAISCKMAGHSPSRSFRNMAIQFQASLQSVSPRLRSYARSAQAGASKLAWDFLKALHEKETEKTKHATSIDIAHLTSAVEIIAAEVPKGVGEAYEAMVDFANAHFDAALALGHAYGGCGAAAGDAEDSDNEGNEGSDKEAVALAKRVCEHTLHAVDQVLADQRHFVGFFYGHCGRRGSSRARRVPSRAGH
jgi:hypothetical protein